MPEILQSGILNGEAAFLTLKNLYNLEAEEFWGLFLDHQLQIKQLRLLHRGTLESCTIHPRDLFREAVRANSFAIIIAHNHTSFNLQPSLQDIKLTKKLRKLSLLLEIPIIDHIIFSDINYYSFKEHQLI